MNKKKQILIVDDDENVTFILNMNLSVLNNECHVEVVNDSLSALTKVKSKTYDLILTDYQMPKMNGVEFAHHIREISPNTQIILMTNYDAIRLPEIIGDLRLDGYIDKHLKLDQVHTIVRQTLGFTEQSSDTSQSNKHVSLPSTNNLLQKLQISTAADCILLLDYDGDLVEQQGQVDAVNMPSISTLIAADFKNSEELTNLLENSHAPTSACRELYDYNIYTHRVGKYILLAVIYSIKRDKHIVRHHTRKTAHKLINNKFIPDMVQK